MKIPPLKNSYLFPWLILAVILLTLGSFTAYSLYEEHERLDKHERERLTTQAKVIEENIAGQLTGVYRALIGIRKDLHLWKGATGRALANRQMVALSDAMPGIHAFLITDASGTILSSNFEEVIGKNISYREYFQAPLKGQNLSTLYLSSPFRTIMGNFVINVALMIPGPKGEFAGVVSASLDPGYFNILLDSVLYAPDMWAAIAHGDGKQFMMIPDRPGMAGLDLAHPGSFFTRHRESGRKTSIFTGIVHATGEERMMAIRTINPDNVHMDKPLVVAVGRKMSALYADWPGEVWGRAAMLVVLALTMILALYSYQQRQRKFEAISAGVVEELLQAKEAALRANVAKSRFLATVAHEFRTPLSILTSSTDILDRYGERLNREERSQQHERIRNAARHMSDLVDSVLSFNRLAALSPLKKPVMVNVGQFCQDLAEEVRGVCGDGHEFRIAIAADCGTPLVDAVLFRRIVENLLTNAFRYTPSGGAVSLQVSREGNRLQVVVTDSGIGIPEECQPRIFEAFYRCPNVEVRRGLGLGLSIVHDALTHLGGTIAIESSIGKGTIMRVEIPVDHSPDPEEQTCSQS